MQQTPCWFYSDHLSINNNTKELINYPQPKLNYLGAVHRLIIKGVSVGSFINYGTVCSYDNNITKQHYFKQKFFMDVILAVLLKNNSIINIALLNNYNITTFISSFRSLILSKTGPTAFSLLNLDSPFVTVLLSADSALVSALLVTTLRSGSCPT